MLLEFNKLIKYLNLLLIFKINNMDLLYLLTQTPILESFVNIYEIRKSLYKLTKSINNLIKNNKHILVSFPSDPINYAIRTNDLNLLIYCHKYLNVNNEYWDIAMDWAAENGHMHVVQWLHENRKEGCTTDAMDYAARNGHLDVVK